MIEVPKYWPLNIEFLKPALLKIDSFVFFSLSKEINMSNNGVHFNKKLDLKLKQLAEKMWIEKFASKDISYEDKIEEFIDVFGRNYLD